MTPEGVVLKACERYLELKGYLWWRQNNLPVFDKTRGTFRAFKGKRELSDLIAVLPGKVAFIEVKRKDWTPSKHWFAGQKMAGQPDKKDMNREWYQGKFLAEVRALGQVGFVATCVEDLEKEGL